MALPARAQQVQDALTAAGHAHQVVEMPESTRTAADAARACGCDVAQIAKSLIFRGASTGDAILVITSGAHRVHEARLGKELGEPLARADADFVREQTGFTIGGVPPLAHARPINTIIDQALLDHCEIWAAAGTPRCVFKLSPAELAAMTGGRVMAVS